MRRRTGPMESRSFPVSVARQDTTAALLGLLNIAQRWSKTERALPSAFVIRLLSL